MCKLLYYGVQVQIEISYNQGRLRSKVRDRNKYFGSQQDTSEAPASKPNDQSSIPEEGGNQ